MFYCDLVHFSFFYLFQVLDEMNQDEEYVRQFFIRSYFRVRTIVEHAIHRIRSEGGPIGQSQLEVYRQIMIESRINYVEYLTRPCQPSLHDVVVHRHDRFMKLIETRIIKEMKDQWEHMYLPRTFIS